jgi:hypothetical protein
LLSALSVSQPRSGMPTISAYSARCISFAKRLCHFGGAGSIPGTGPMHRTAGRARHGLLDGLLHTLHRHFEAHASPDVADATRCAATAVMRRTVGARPR